MVIPRRSCVETGEHVLTECSECLQYGWCAGEYCPDGQGYYEVCTFCGEPMGNERRKWKAAGRPAVWPPRAKPSQDQP